MFGFNLLCCKDLIVISHLDFLDFKRWIGGKYNPKYKITRKTFQMASGTGQKVILIVEDDDASFLYLESILRRTNAIILHAFDGTEALNFCQSQEISLVLMDLKMPVMDGFEATRRIKTIKPDLLVIAITAYAMNGDEQKALNAGCDDYLTKPLKKDLLLSRLDFYGIT